MGELWRAVDVKSQTHCPVFQETNDAAAASSAALGEKMALEKTNILPH